MNQYSGKCVLVVGASGFIGRWVARALTAVGADLHLLVRDANAMQALCAPYAINGHIHTVDLRDTAAIQGVYNAVRPALTFNLAGYGVDRDERDQVTAYQINRDAVVSLANAAAVVADPNWEGLQFVHVGSALEYGIIGGDLSEISTPKPTTLYGLSKLAGTTALTTICHRQQLRGVTARLFTVYGPGEHSGRLLPSLLALKHEMTPLPLSEGMQKRDFTYVNDVAMALLRLGLCQTTSETVFNVATGKLTTVRQFVQTAAATLNIPDTLLQFGALPTRPEEMVHDPVAITRLRQLLTWVPQTTIGDGVRQTAEFFASR
jgi:nucleoside-diphosphate-sugar epimerase